MKAKRLLESVAFFLVLILTLAACESEPQSARSRGSSSRSSVKQLIDNDTDSLSRVTDWASAQKLYAQIKKTDIERHVKSERVKDDMFGLLDKAYCHSMDTIMFGVLSGACQSNHKLLREIHAVRMKEEYANIGTNIHDDVEQKFKSHEEMIGFINKTKGNRQGVSSYKDNYDASFEKKQMTTASGYKAKDPVCSEIKNGLDAILDGSAFNSRRKAYCDKIVQLYIEADNYDPKEHKAIGAKIREVSRCFNKRGEPLNDSAEKWVDDLQSFKDLHEQDN